MERFIILTTDEDDTYGVHVGGYFTSKEGDLFDGLSSAMRYIEKYDRKLVWREVSEDRIKELDWFELGDNQRFEVDGEFAIDEFRRNYTIVRVDC